MYAPSVFDISGGSWLGPRITGADRDAIVNGLEPACNELQFSALVGAETYICKHDRHQLANRVGTYIGQKGPSSIGEDCC